MSYAVCMKYKCKSCPWKIECELKMIEERLTYKPFENLKEILEKKKYVD